MDAARRILERGDVVVIFPEGTRTRPGALGTPKRGVGRLALETGAPIVPVALIGTEAIRRGWRIRPHKVRIRAGRPLRFPQVDAALAGARARGDRSHLAVHRAAVGMARRHARAAPRGDHRRRLLGHRPGGRVRPRRPRRRARLPHRAAGRAPAAHARQRPLPAGHPAARRRPRHGRRRARAGSRRPRLLRGPRGGAARRGRGARRTRSALAAGVLVLCKGLVAPHGTLPSAYVAERVDARAVACIGGPSHAADALDSGAVARHRLRRPDLRDADRAPLQGRRLRHDDDRRRRRRRARRARRRTRPRWPPPRRA